MELYVINDNGELVTYNKIKYEKKEYTGEVLEKILKKASEYHIKEIYDYYYTDFNDKDSEYKTSFEEIKEESIVVKDDDFYGVYLKGGSMYESYEVIITLDNLEVKVGDGSDYSYTYWTWILTKKDSK